MIVNKMIMSDKDNIAKKKTINNGKTTKIIRDGKEKTKGDSEEIKIMKDYLKDLEKIINNKKLHQEKIANVLLLIIKEKAGKRSMIGKIIKNGDLEIIKAP